MTTNGNPHSTRITVPSLLILLHLRLVILELLFSLRSTTPDLPNGSDLFSWRFGSVMVGCPRSSWSRLESSQWPTEHWGNGLSSPVTFWRCCVMFTLVVFTPIRQLLSNFIGDPILGLGRFDDIFVFPFYFS